MFSAQARWLVLAGLSGSALLACSGDATPENSGTAGMSSGGSAAGNQTAGSTSTAGNSSTAGTQSGGGTAGASSTAGTTGTAAGTGGSGGAGGASGGAGGASGGAGAGGGGAGGGAAMPTAVANIMGINGQTVTGTATFTQGATMTKLVLNLTACPDGPHSSHLHLMKDCGNNGALAGGHWTPNGEMLGDYSCTANKGTLEISKPTSMWTVGDPSATDVTKYSFMVHETSDAMASGMRIGCGLINKQ